MSLASLATTHLHRDRLSDLRWSGVGAEQDRQSRQIDGYVHRKSRLALGARVPNVHAERSTWLRGGLAPPSHPDDRHDRALEGRSAALFGGGRLYRSREWLHGQRVFCWIEALVEGLDVPVEAGHLTSEGRVGLL
jgi:hypothetical protein